MVISKRRILALAGVAALSGVGVLVGSSMVSGTSPRPAVIDGHLADELHIDTDSLAGGDLLPILPLEPIVDVYEGYQIVVGRYGGLAEVSAELNGTPLRVRTHDDVFVLSVGALRGEGPATLLLTERFDDGSSVTLPYTVYVGDHDVTAETKSVSAPTAALWTVSLPYGLGDDEVGFVEGAEAMAVTPAAIVGLPNGSVGVLDTANQRVVAVAADGSVKHVVALPSGAFVAFAASSNMSSVVAIDPVNAIGVDLATGISSQLPGVVRVLSLATSYSLDGETLFATHPGDGLQYSIGTSGGRAVDGAVERRADAGRVVVKVGVNVLSVQMSPDAVPIDVPVDGDDLAVLDQLRLADGRMVALTAIKTADTWRTELFVIDGTTINTIPVELDGRLTMTSYLAAIDGAVVVADPALTAFNLTAYPI